MEENILLILDLDETLIHATENKLNIEEDFKYANYYVYKRPLLKDFLIEMSKYFKLAIWSSADDKYVNDIVERIKPIEVEFEFIFGKSRCTVKRDYELDQYVNLKRLKKLKRKGFQLERILIVDDSPEKTQQNFGNAIYISAYEGNLEDTELKHLSEFLINLKDVKNVRTIEKRRWRE
ncbi:MAG: phosphoprotein phosphatase [Flavobacteriales bacterium]|nr:MAG: phosphoprotein phosphatase [Flavobacteriales bacterium]